MFHILLIDDGADAAALVDAVDQEQPRHCQLHLVTNGSTAMHFLNRTTDHARSPSPDLIILSLELRRESGLDVLSALKGSSRWCALPVVAMSRSVPDVITQAYALHANCCVVRPSDTISFLQVVNSIKHFWTTVAKLPSHH